ncbi:MAG: LD-carboxypeptidase [Rickettsiales bacterium]|nr:LD-carboxypeptidase [Rickettsiales bacterium]
MTYSLTKKQVFVDIISPASAIDFSELEAIKSFLKASGFQNNFFGENKLVLDKKVDYEFSFFSALDRFKQFEKAIYSDKSDVIWCAKGGYGTIELVEFFKKLKKPKKKKLLIGFSDITILNKILIEKFGWNVVVAPMPLQIVKNTVLKDPASRIVALIQGKVGVLEYKLDCLLGGKYNISAQIVGGCLSVLASQFGTKNQINFKNKILFLEDEGESGERIDRYFSQILQIITETKHYPKAILLGNFFQENIHGNINNKNIEFAIARLTERVKGLKKEISIFRDTNGFLGHSEKMRPLILGLKSEISNATLTQNLLS